MGYWSIRTLIKAHEIRERRLQSLFHDRAAAVTTVVTQSRLARDDAYGSVLATEAAAIEAATGRVGSSVSVAEFQQSEWVEAKQADLQGVAELALAVGRSRS